MNPTPQQADEAFNLHAEAPLHRLAPLTILHELFEQWGSICAAHKQTRTIFPPGFMRLQIGGGCEFFNEDNLRSMLRGAHATLLNIIRLNTLNSLSHESETETVPRGTKA